MLLHYFEGRPEDLHVGQRAVCGFTVTEVAPVSSEGLEQCPTCLQFAEALEAHKLGRHASTHPDDKAFWSKTCPACEVLSRLEGLRRYNGTAPGARAIARARAELDRLLPEETARV